MPIISATAISPHRIGKKFDWSSYCTPQLILTPNLYTEEMDATTGWSVTGGTIALNTTEKHSGTGSIKVTSNTTSARLNKDVTWDLSACQGASIRVWAYIHSDPAITLTSINIKAFTLSGTTHYYSATYAGTLPQNEWFLVTLPAGGWIATGTPDWSQVTTMRMTLTVPGGQVCECSFDLLFAGETMKKAILIMSDDSHPSVYDKMYAYMKTKKMVGTHYMIGERFDDAGQLTTAQVQEMYNYGWDFGNHLDNGNLLTGLTAEQVEAKLDLCDTELVSRGLTRAKNHVAYPGGAYDANTLTAMASFGAETGRTLGYTGYDFKDLQPYPYKLYASTVLNTSAVATVKGWIDKQLSVNTIPALLFHMIKDVTDGLATTYVTSDFQQIIDYIETLGLQTLTISEYYRLWTTAITVHHK